MEVQKSQTVRELAAVNPGAARVFEKFGIDYCCGGEKSLTEACRAAEVNLDEVKAALEKPTPGTEERDWQRASLGELAAYIVEKHHGFTREEISRLTPLLAKVLGVHGQNHPELSQIHSAKPNCSSNI